MHAFMHGLLVAATVAAWLIALHWTRITLTALRKLPHVPDLLDPRYDAIPKGPADPDLPAVTVIVPARNEAATLEATLRSLLAQTIPVDIIAINDRSTDQTGAIMARLAAGPLPAGKSLTILKVDLLPAGWMGKTHAMALAARQTATPWLLFTDGDILFRNDALERALRFAEASQADHVPLALSLILKSPGERLMITVLQCFSLLTFRPWKIPDPAAKHDSVGIGGFNLIRASVYQAIGGFESLRMEVLEDLRLGFEVKRQGFRQRVVFGRDVVRVHWARGALGMAHNLTKNFFAVFRFRPLALLIGAVVLGLLLWMPFVGLFGPWPMRSASLVSLGLFILGHRYSSRHFTAIPMAYLLTLPIGTGLLVYSLLRSMVLTIARGGVVWRGTFYPLKELRRHAGPLR
jgi:cellulose synthase/poly-beta-1,6-N-acetylglucosamine synthase-like glycosyltransferase